MFVQNSTIAPFFQYILFFLIMIIVALFGYFMIYVGNKLVKEERRIRINWNTVLKVIVLVIIGVIISELFNAYPILGNTAFALGVGVIVAFLLNPVVSWLETKGLSRGKGVIISYLGIVLLLAVLFISIIPELVKELSAFLSNLPTSIDYTYQSLREFLISKNIDYRVLDNLRQQLNEYLVNLSNNIPEWTTQIINTIQGSVGTLVTIVLIPLIAYHLLVSKDVLLAWIYNKLPKAIKHDALYLGKEINFAMNEFVRSRLLMAVFIGVATGIMLQLFGIPFAWVIGFMTMVLDIVPYVGPVLATAPALIFAFIKSPIIMVWIMILSWMLQWIEQNIVGARLFADSSGIHELLILLSIIIGGGMFGVWGMILSVPFVIIIKIIVEYVDKKLRGIRPEFTKDIEKEMMKQIKKNEKAKAKAKAKSRRK